MKQLAVHGLFLAALLSLGGCMVAASGISPSTDPIRSDQKYTVIGPAQCSSWGVIIYGIPLSMGDTKDAVECAKSQTGADALIGVTTHNHTYNLMVVYLTRIRVTGTAVKISKK